MSDIWTRRDTTLIYGDFTSVNAPENVTRLPGGGCRLTASRINENSWNSGLIDSLGKYAFQYGYAEARVKLHKAKGLNGAFFLMNILREELDFECIDPQAKNLQLTVHATGNTSQANIERVGYVDLSEDWHLYGFEWSADFVKWYLDRQLIWTQTERVPQIAMYINFALVADAWAGLPDETTPSPSYLDIEVVKVWQK